MLGADFDLPTLDKCVLFGGAAVYAEGHKGIERYSAEEIVLRLNRPAALTISGRDLKIVELSRQDILVKGVIKSVVRG